MNIKQRKFISLFLIFSIFIGLSNLYGQLNSKNDFPKITPFIHIFSDFNTNLNSNNTLGGFELTRVHLGLKASLSENIDGIVCYDATNPNDGGKLDRTGYLKQAFIRFYNNHFVLNFGMIPLKQMDLLENFWGHRYIYRSFQEQYGFGYFYDLGATLEYKPNSEFSFDASFMNGEGIFTNQKDNTFKGGLGVTYYLDKLLVIREYADFTAKSTTQSTFSSFIGITPVERISIGGEFNYQWNNNYFVHHNFYGLSVYSTYNIASQFNVFARYDYLRSVKNDDNTEWNINNDGEKIIIGAEYKLLNNVRASVNYQNWIPSLKASKDIKKLYLNFEIKY
jgi:hypothetical protein